MHFSASSVLLLCVGAAVGFFLGMLWTRRRAGGANGTVSRSTLREIANQDTGDTIADADRRMAHGAYRAASDLVEAAVSGSPNDLPLLAKHLEVLFIWGNGEEFLDRASHYASALKGSSEWDKVKVMGTTMHPDRELFR